MKKTLSPREIARIGIFAAITAILSQISIPLPFTPVPISLGLVAVYTCGIFFRPSLAALTQICYLLIGSAGLPVFAGFRGGLSALAGPTGGYLMAYPFMAAIVAYGINSIKGSENEKIRAGKALYVRGAIFMGMALAGLYLGGTAWFSLVSGNSFQDSLALAVYPFIPLDIFKIGFCTLAVLPLRSRLIEIGLLSFDSAKARKA